MRPFSDIIANQIIPKALSPGIFLVGDVVVVVLLVVVVDAADVCVCAWCGTIWGGGGWMRWWSECLCVFVWMHVNIHPVRRWFVKQKKWTQYSAVWMITFLRIMHTNNTTHTNSHTALPRMLVHAYSSKPTSPPPSMPSPANSFFGRELTSIWKAPPLLPVDNLRFFNSPEPLTSTQRDSPTQGPGEPTQQREKENKANLQSLKKLKRILW